MGVQEAAPPESVPAVESLTFETAGAELAVRISTTSPVPPFLCRLVDDAAGDVVIDFPGARSALQERYPLGAGIVRQVTVERLSGDAGGVRLRLRVENGMLKGLEQIGRGVVLRFGQASGSAADGPSARQSYRVGVGDKLDIGVFGHPDMGKTVEVRGDGSIPFPLIGDVQVAGKTVEEIDRDVTRILGTDYLVGPEVSVEVREYMSQWVTLIGEVRTPGRYVLKRNMRLIDLLAEAGGPSKEAGSRIVVTKRDTGDAPSPQIVIERDALLGGKDPDLNVLLSHGDIVTIGEKDVFYIRGEVARPGSYFMERDMTLMKAISVAGGFSQFANRKAIELLRARDAGGQEKLVVNLKAIEDGKREDIALQPNDVIIVPRRIF